MSMYMHRQGGGRPSGSGWEVGRVPDNHLTKQKMSIGYTHAYVVYNKQKPVHHERSNGDMRGEEGDVAISSSSLSDLTM